jgi:hypothetical protein
MNTLFFDYIQKDVSAKDGNRAFLRLKDMLLIPEWLDVLKCTPEMEEAAFIFENATTVSSPCRAPSNERDGQDWLQSLTLDDEPEKSFIEQDVKPNHKLRPHQPDSKTSNFVEGKSAVALLRTALSYEELLVLGSVQESSGFGSTKHYVSFSSPQDIEEKASDLEVSSEERAVVEMTQPEKATISFPNDPRVIISDV